jgi:hypothetical protein
MSSLFRSSPPGGFPRHHTLLVALALIVLTIALLFAGNMATGYLFIVLGAAVAVLVMNLDRGGVRRRD